jgi:hypothetical protein
MESIDGREEMSSNVCFLSPAQDEQALESMFPFLAPT